MLGWFKRKKSKENEPLAEEINDTGSELDSESDSTDEPAQPAAREEAEEPAETDKVTEEPAVSETGEAIEPVPQEVTKEAPAPKAPSVLQKLSEKLSRTRATFTSRIDELFLGKKQIDAELFEDLEEILITADLGISTTMELLEQARRQVKRDKLSDPQALKLIIKEQLRLYLAFPDQTAAMALPAEGPFVIMVVGVNGVGKTTTIGKIARKFVDAGQSVLLVAADTFRAAAASQLKIWGERNEIRVIAQQEGADPSSVVYDALEVAKSKNYDVVLIDTAGRLHTKVNLMEELKKIKRVVSRQIETAPHETLLVIDATTGQNGISQATLFNEAVGISGIALTKLDGTAKGGIIANISREIQAPIRFIGVGEQIGDLRDFDPDEFVNALFE